MSTVKTATTNIVDRLRNGPQRIKAAAAATVDGDTATIRLYDAIDSWGGEWGVSAKEFVEVLDQIGSVKNISLHINSPGGDVFDAITIMNALRQHPARVVATVDGIAASAASFIAASADELVMSPNSELMIHDAHGLAIGNAADMRQMADLLDHVSDNVASVYAAKSGGDVADWRAAMERETWLSAEEAVAAGLADSVAGEDAKVENAFDLSLFNFAGRKAAPEPEYPVPHADHKPSNEATEPVVLTKTRARVAALAATHP